MTMEESQLDVLYDHYKESFGLVRETERARDRNFLVLIGLLSILGVQIAYPVGFSQAMSSVSIGVIGLSAGSLPSQALITATWVFTFVLTLRYCQLAVQADRRYPYIHRMESMIDKHLGGSDHFKREGAGYLEDYPQLLNFAWIVYVFVFPVLILVAVVSSIFVELFVLEVAPLHLILDIVAAIGIGSTLYFYRFRAYLEWGIDKWKASKEPLDD